MVGCLLGSLNKFIPCVKWYSRGSCVQYYKAEYWRTDILHVSMHRSRRKSLEINTLVIMLFYATGHGHTGYDTKTPRHRNTRDMDNVLD